MVLSGTGAILDYYSKISKNFHYEVRIPVGAINESASILLYQDKAAEVILLLEHGIKLYPYSATLYGMLAEVYLIQSEIDQAIKYYQMAFDKSDGSIEDELKYKSLLEAVKE